MKERGYECGEMAVGGCGEAGERQEPAGRRTQGSADSRGKQVYSDAVTEAIAFIVRIQFGSNDHGDRIVIRLLSELRHSETSKKDNYKKTQSYW